MVIAQEKGEDAVYIVTTPSNLLNLAAFSTRAAIMEVWFEVESAVVAVANSFWGQSSSEIFRNMSKL